MQVMMDKNIVCKEKVGKKQCANYLKLDKNYLFVTCKRTRGAHTSKFIPDQTYVLVQSLMVQVETQMSKLPRIE
jgi:hypothetical protein